VNAAAERRRHERFTFTSVLEVRLSGQPQWLEARACDVSVSGLSFVIGAALKVGDEIRLGLPNSEGSQFVLEATVRHVRENGAEFVIGAERKSN
jgi:hypothetical protein